MASGVVEIVPLDSLDALGTFREQGYQCAAERGGKRVGDAEWGNSPTLYHNSNLNGVRLAFSSTNGTVALLRATDAERILVGAFSNLTLLADYIAAQPHDVVVLCSGWKGKLSLEDTLFAGALVQRLDALGSHQAVNDAANVAASLWHSAAADPYGFCEMGTHFQRLKRLGCDDDVRFAFQYDTCPVLPEYIAGYSIRKLT